MILKASSNFCREMVSISLIVFWRVLDGLQQILPLRFQELVTLRDLFVLLQRHHVHRTHVVEPRAHFAIGFFFAGERLGGDAGQGIVGHQLLRLLAQLLHAGLGHVLHIGLHTRLRG